MTATAPFADILPKVEAKARDAAVFGDITTENHRLLAAAANSAEPAFYRLETDAGKVWVSLVTADRWLSESVEADLMHSGDTLEELLEEELIDLGYDLTDAERPLAFEHFRSDDMLFTFRTPIPASTDAAVDADRAALFLLAYEAAFRQLGDIDAGEDDD